MGGFASASFLIGKSYLGWQQSPITTSITTRPIEQLDFPVVTVCPPLGSNTALFHDLIKADNNSLSQDDRKKLKEDLHEIFLKSSHNYFTHSMLVLVNPDNVKRMFEGFQSVPSKYSHTGTEIRVSGKEGSIESSGFQGIFDEASFKDDKLLHLILEIPDDLKEQMGSGTFVIELEVDVRKAEGWEEEVFYLEGHGYTKSKKMFNWKEAKADCDNQQKQLAKVGSAWEQEQVDSMTNSRVWIGGRKDEQEDRWKWTDGSPLSFEKWMPDPYKRL